ncbi:MAG: hypothetical protein NTY76_00040 [Candidatus Omnitrophica bacterium]|nr:hypothetical protein [Candidatus Omnitrophota bacterium]
MRNSNFILQLVICVMVLAACVAEAGDDIALRAYINRNQITIGDRIKFTIEITASRGTQIQMPAFKNNIIGVFEIKDSAGKMTGGLFGKKTFHSWYYITAYSVGKKEIPALDIKYKTASAKDWAVKKTGALSVDVRSVLPKEFPADIKDIKGPVSFFEINWFLTGGLLAGLIILITLLVIIKKARETKPLRLPHETALEELEAIRSQLINSGDIKEYFVGVSDCVRRYIERAFNLKAPEMTSEEFLNSLRDSNALTMTHKELLRGFMNACDLVKFAKYKPTGEETEKVYVTAKNFIEETKEVK